MIKQTEVLIIGGGTAGSIAAIQSARAGAKTVLVEANSILGGTISIDNVAFPGLFHAHGRQVIRGIGWELITESVKMNSDKLQDFSKPFSRSHTEHHIHINKDIFALLLEEKCINSGVEIRYYETPVRADLIDGLWYVDLVGKGTNQLYKCYQLIDCTGNASLTQLAGYKIMRSEITQPGSLMFKLCGYELENLDFNLLQKAYEKALVEGILKKEEFFSSIERFLSVVHYKNNRNTFSNHIAEADSTTSVTHTNTNIYSRTILLRVLRFLRSLPGLGNISISYLSPQTAVRETNRIDAIHNITIDEYISGTKYQDSICYSFYPIDLHNKDGVEPKKLETGVVPEIPLRAMIPKESENFIVAGRCIGSDQLANSALRVQATCMAVGQAAGAVAAISCREKCTPLNVLHDDIKLVLQENDAILP